MTPKLISKRKPELKKDIHKDLSGMHGKRVLMYVLLKTNIEML